MNLEYRMRIASRTLLAYDRTPPVAQPISRILPVTMTFGRATYATQNRLVAPTIFTDNMVPRPHPSLLQIPRSG